MADSNNSTTAILYALTTPHEKRSLEPFNEWYDTKHAPSRARCPGIHSVSRWRSTDGKRPTWLATYELSQPSALDTDEYKAARQADGDDEATMFSDLSRRVYKLISDKKDAVYVDYVKANKPRAMTHIAVHPAAGSDVSDEEFNRWYEDEHVPLLSKCPGWLRSTRWTLLNERDPRPDGKDHTESTARFLACHEWKSARVAFESEEFRHAVTTPWREKIMTNVDPATEERRMWVAWSHHRNDSSCQHVEVNEIDATYCWEDVMAVPKTAKI